MSEDRVRVVLDLDKQDAEDLISALDRECADRYHGARTPTVIKHALRLSQLIGRVRTAYARAAGIHI